MDETGELCSLMCFSMFKGHSSGYVVFPMCYTVVSKFLVKFVWYHIAPTLGLFERCWHLHIVCL